MPGTAAGSAHTAVADSWPTVLGRDGKSPVPPDRRIRLQCGVFRCAGSWPCCCLQRDIPVAVRFGFNVALYVDAHSVVIAGAVGRPIRSARAVRVAGLDE